jgi:hypothetical protein
MHVPRLLRRHALIRHTRGWRNRGLVGCNWPFTRLDAALQGD